MKKRLILLVLTILSISSVFSSTSKITGVVLDRETKEPVTYAHVVILSTKFATTSNEKGEFTLKVSNKKNLVIRISCIGYKTLEMKLSELESVLYLDRHTYTLDEVIVDGNMPSAQDYIAKAFSKVKDNYIVNNHLLTGYFNEGEYDNNSPIYTAESIVEAKLPTITDLYHNRKIRYLDKRKEVHKELSKYKLKFKTSGAERSLKYSMTDPINAMSPSHFEKYKYEIKGFENYDGRRVVVISFEDDARLQVYGLFFIDLETYAFIRLEGNQLHGDGGPFDNWKWKHHKWIEVYKQNDEDLYYLEGSLYIGNWINKRRKAEYELRSFFVTDKIEPNKGFSPESTELPYKEAFFKSINKSKENLLENINSENIKIVKDKLYKGIPEYSRIKKPYRK